MHFHIKLYQAMLFVNKVLTYLQWKQVSIPWSPYATHSSFVDINLNTSLLVVISHVPQGVSYVRQLMFISLYLFCALL